VVGFLFCAYVKLNKSKGFCFGALPVLFYEIHELKFDEPKKKKKTNNNKRNLVVVGGPHLLLTSVV
jgi:hypothetical protein